MAQTGYTPLQIYSSSTASAAPSAGNLTNSALGSELAINITDGKLFYKDNGGSVQVIGWKTVPTTAGGTGLTSYTAGDLVYYASGTAFTKLAIGTSGRYLSSSGTAPQWSAPAALTKTDDTNVTLTLGGSPSTALLNAASLTLGWTGQLSLTRGGTNASLTATNGGVVYSTATAMAITAAGTSNQVLISNGAAAPSWASVLQSSNMPVGSVLQVVSATYSTQTTSTSSTYADTGLTVTITPKFSTSKILVLVNQNGVAKKSNNTSFNGVSIRLLRGATELIKVADSYGYTGTQIDNVSGQASSAYLDSPATTNATTYKTQFLATQNVDGVIVQNGSAVSTITVLEIAA